MSDFKQHSNQPGGKPEYRQHDSDRPRSNMHQATCANCGKRCEVPFRPNGQRPVYCNDCFRREPAADSSRPASPAGQARGFQRPAFQAPGPRHAPPQPQPPDPRIDEIKRHLAKIESKLDQVLVSMAVAKAQAIREVSTPKPKKSPKKK